MSENSEALNRFSAGWKLNGDLIECRKCRRSQHVSWVHEDFKHRAGCRSEGKVCADPWKTLGALIVAGISQSVGRVS